MSQHFVQLVRIKTKEKTYIFPSHHKQNVVSQKFLCFDTDIFLERTLFSLCFHMFIVYLRTYPHITYKFFVLPFYHVRYKPKENRGEETMIRVYHFFLYSGFFTTNIMLWCVWVVFFLPTENRERQHTTTMMSFE